MAMSSLQPTQGAYAMLLKCLYKLPVTEHVAEKLEQRATRWNQRIAGLAKQALPSAQYCKPQALPPYAASTARCCFSRRPHLQFRS